MNENNVTIDMTNLSDDERKQLVVLIEKANAPRDKRWKPTHGTLYYFVNGAGNVEYDGWDDTIANNKRFAINNCYPTREAAEFAAEKLRVIAELSQFASDKHNGGCDYYYLACGVDKGNIRIHRGDMYTGELHFATHEDAEQAIETVGADRIKKYYLGV